MAEIPTNDAVLEIARQARAEFASEIGGMGEYHAVTVFGYATNLDVGIATDIHDNPALAIHVAPTEARAHDVASSDAGDDGDPVGLGAQILRVWGLKTWADKESVIDLVLNGTTDVVTIPLVFVNRMEVIAWGATNVNIGVIKATADTDNTVSAQINAGEGETHMALLGIPSTQKLFIKSYFGTSISPASQSVIGFKLLANTYAGTVLTRFATKHQFSLDSDVDGSKSHIFGVPLEIAGPAIVKIQGTSTVINSIATAGFDGILVDN